MLPQVADGTAALALLDPLRNAGPIPLPGPVSGVVDAVTNPSQFLLSLLAALLRSFVESATKDLDAVLTAYLLRTEDVSTLGAFTGRIAVRNLNLGMAAAMDVLVGAVLLVMFLRTTWERSARGHYALKTTFPKLLGAIVLVHCSLPLMQMVIDLNNALGTVALSLGDPNRAGARPWSAALSEFQGSQFDGFSDIFIALFGVALVAAVAILALAYVVRYALLTILVVLAPCAALCGVLPETRSYARTWMRLFLSTLFMQAVQLVIFRIATVSVLTPGAGMAEMFYALATLYIALKVPGALNTASHWETKAKTASHELEKALRKAIDGGRVTRRASS